MSSCCAGHPLAATSASISEPWRTAARHCRREHHHFGV